MHWARPFQRRVEAGATSDFVFSEAIVYTLANGSLRQEFVHHRITPVFIRLAVLCIINFSLQIPVLHEGEYELLATTN